MSSAFADAQKTHLQFCSHARCRLRTPHMPQSAEHSVQSLHDVHRVCGTGDWVIPTSGSGSGSPVARVDGDDAPSVLLLAGGAAVVADGIRSTD